MPLLTAFPPILPAHPHTLILGTMPGIRSLQEGQYYAHPHNQFWQLMGDVYGAGPWLSYERRVDILKREGVAVWDVLQACEREGSLDSAIKNPVINDFEGFYRDHPSIERVVFDSLTAEKLYKRLALPVVTKALDYRRVPSPSPAHARVSYEAKLALWREALKRPVASGF
jgi:double-stranded uracil-DNA glycosylase